MALLPQPRKWHRTQQQVAISRDVKVRRPNRSSRRARQPGMTRLLDRALSDLLEAMPEQIPTRNRAKLCPSLELVLIDESGDGHGLESDEAYRITVTPAAIRIVGSDILAIRNGLVTLTGLVTVRDGVAWLPGGEITDWPDLPMRGFHLDLTCQSLNFDYVCSLLRRLAAYKYNAVLLEWGDKFPYQGHRILAHPTDAFTVRQAAQLLELAETLGLVVIPLIQTLTHAEFILRHPQFAHLSEVPGDIYQLATSNPESLVLAKQLVDQLIESHAESPYVHLGGSLARQLGEGASADAVAAKGKSLAWVEYMNVICRHVQARGRTPIVWTDMLVGHPQALNRFTRDCLLMHWNYATTQAVAADFEDPGIGRVNARTCKGMDPEIRERYEPFWKLGGAKPPRTFYTPAPVAYLQNAGFSVIVAASVRSRGDSYAAPRLRHAVDNCLLAAHTAAEHNCLGLMVTSWSIRRTPIETTLPALIAAADIAWNAAGVKHSKEFENRLAESVAASGKTDLIPAMDAVGREGAAALNGAGATNGWDRRHERWGVPPLLGRLRRAELGSLTATSDPVRLVRKVQRDARNAARRLARVTPAEGMDRTFAAAWRYAARETGHKAAQWLYLWQVCRLIKVDRGSAEKLAKEGMVLLEDLRRCQRDLKKSVGPTLTPNGLEDETDIRFGSEARLIRRIVKILRSRASRADQRMELAAMMGLAETAPAAS
ncbi:MAG: hypothetical protein BIFFINMI_01759 [Phycisphaerae bacterium]|nr:hypothetical protein [Phycisphaerae bacterium]